MSIILFLKMKNWYFVNFIKIKSDGSFLLMKTDVTINDFDDHMDKLLGEFFRKFPRENESALFIGDYQKEKKILNTNMSISDFVHKYNLKMRKEKIDDSRQIVEIDFCHSNDKSIFFI